MVPERLARPAGSPKQKARRKNSAAAPSSITRHRAGGSREAAHEPPAS